MGLISIKKKKSKIGFFVNRFKNIKFRDQGKIEKNYDKRLPDLLAKLANSLSRYPSIDFLIIFVEKERRRTWYSEFSGRVVINSTFYPDGPEFNKDFQKAVEDFQLIELEVEALN